MLDSSDVMVCVFVLLIVCFFFFFKQKTAYEMRISDWSSDVCSSDLLHAVSGRPVLRALVRLARHLRLGADAAAGGGRGLSAVAVHRPHGGSRGPRLAAVSPHPHPIRPVADRPRHLHLARCRAGAGDDMGSGRPRTPSTEDRRVGKESVSTCRTRW